jgi:hypothetical protein
MLSTAGAHLILLHCAVLDVSQAMCDSLPRDQILWSKQIVNHAYLSKMKVNVFFVTAI